MKKNIDNKDIEAWFDSWSLDWLNSSEIAGKFDKQMDRLKQIANAENAENNAESENMDKLIDDFFDIEKVQDYDKVSKSNSSFVDQKYRAITDRGVDIQKSIVSSWNSVLSDIVNWWQEKHPVAKSFLGIANWILKSESV